MIKMKRNFQAGHHVALFDCCGRSYFHIERNEIAKNQAVLPFPPVTCSHSTNVVWRWLCMGFIELHNTLLYKRRMMNSAYAHRLYQLEEFHVNLNHNSTWTMNVAMQRRSCKDTEVYSRDVRRSYHFWCVDNWPLHIHCKWLSAMSASAAQSANS